jgi:tRNA (guanine37-N1)-methyltransferase
MHFDLITLFPEMFAALSAHGVSGRALERGLWSLTCWNPREQVQTNYKSVDDRPYGGGPGMVMMAPHLAATLARIRAESASPTSLAPVVYLSAQGQRLDQSLIRSLQKHSRLTLLCGRYEGIDERFIQRHVDIEVSLGDFVLSGGELPAMALMDALVRWIPGALGDGASAEQDSFARDWLLDHPHYTRPEVWEGESVPAELLSGHHLNIVAWRREQALRATFLKRPDLIEAARKAGQLSRQDEALLKSLK